MKKNDSTDKVKLAKRMPRRKSNGAARKSVSQSEPTEALRQTEFKYKSIFENAAIGIYRSTPEGRFLDVNTALARMFGYDSAQELREAVADIAMQLYVDSTCREEFKRTLAERGTVRRFEAEAYRKDGSKFWVSLSGRSVRDKEGHVLYFEGAAEDITEQKRGQEALATERNILRTLIDNLPDFIFIKDSESRFVVDNVAHLKLLGALSQEELVGKTDLDIFPREMARQYYDDEQALIKSGKPLINREESTIYPDGRVQRLLTSKVPLLDAEGKPIGLVGISRDITERKAAEQTIERQKQFLEAIIQHSPVAIVVLDPANRVQRCNPAFERLFGYSESEVVGCDLDTLVTDETTRPDAVEFTRQAMISSTHGTRERRRKDGRTVEVEIFGVPIILEGARIGTVGIYHDITDLVQAQREAEAANQAKSAFLAMMSHEIRTPLNGVIGMTSLLLDTELSAEQQEYAETIRSSGDALLTIINDILDFSKIEANSLTVEKHIFDLRDCIESALDLIAPKAGEKGLDLSYCIDNEVPGSVLGDVTRLRQILNNLLANAVKFTEKGEVTLTVGAEPPATGAETTQTAVLTTQNAVLHFSVRDTGIGIPADRMHRLFRPFSQVDASTARKYGGTGLGLAISKRLSELMGGAMWVESEEGQGSTFHFTLQAESAPRQARVYLRASQPQLRGRRILIVDDNATNRRILSQQVRAWQMVPSDTGSPYQALDWVRRGDPFDVAILDMRMPELDGVSLAKEIRLSRAASALPLVLLTSLGRRESGAASTMFAANLSKPIKPSHLYNALIGIFHAGAMEGEQERPDHPHFDSHLAERFPLRILLAEDHLINQRLALQMLKKMGYRADLAANGLEVLQALERRPYDVILMDVQMPEMDGLAATRRICELWPSGKRPRIIAMTASVMQGDREACLAAGMDDYVGKPIQIKELETALVVAGQRASGVAPGSEPVDWMVVDGLGRLQEEGQPDFVDEMVDLFLKATPPLVAKIREAICSEDVEGLRQAAHALKGNSKSLGARHVSDLCAQLEQIGSAGSVANTELLGVKLEEEFEKARHAFLSRQLLKDQTTGR